MIKIKEAVKLLKVKVTHTNNVWQLNTITDASNNFIKRQEIIFRGSADEFRKLLQKMQAKDTATSPASDRNWTYQQMIDGILSRTDNEIWVWSNLWNQMDNQSKFLTFGDI